MTDICPVANTERLLLTTDGSEFSEGAIREAINLAKLCGSVLTAMTVIQTNPEHAALAPQQLETAERKAKDYLEAVRSRAKHEGIECSTVVREGEDPYRLISDEAVKVNASMIVMGRRGRKGFKRLMMGSTTARVIGHAPCNVLVVPRSAEVRFTRILTATDGSKYSAAAASEAIGTAKRNNSGLIVIAVVPTELATPTDIDFAVSQRVLIAEQEMHDAEKSAKAVKEAAMKEGVQAEAFVMTGKPADAIVEMAKEKQVDLVVLGSHGRTGLERLLMGSVTERTILLSPAAILVVKLSS
jgi:nucleotide-binding universal stress UspA family protein